MTDSGMIQISFVLQGEYSMIRTAPLIITYLFAGLHLLREDIQNQRCSQGTHEEERTQKDQPQKCGL
jgi:hypothetical protein